MPPAYPQLVIYGPLFLGRREDASVLRNAPPNHHSPCLVFPPASMRQTLHDPHHDILRPTAFPAYYEQTLRLHRRNIFTSTNTPALRSHRCQRDLGCITYQISGRITRNQPLPLPRHLTLFTVSQSRIAPTSLVEASLPVASCRKPERRTSSPSMCCPTAPCFVLHAFLFPQMYHSILLLARYASHPRSRLGGLCENIVLCYRISFFPCAFPTLPRIDPNEAGRRHSSVCACMLQTRFPTSTGRSLHPDHELGPHVRLHRRDKLPTSNHPRFEGWIKRDMDGELRMPAPFAHLC